MDHNLPISSTQQVFTNLGKALEACNVAMSAHLASVNAATDSVQYANDMDTDVAKTAPDPVAEKYREDRAKHARQADEFQQISAMLGSSIGVTSPGAEGAKAASEAAKLRKDLVDVHEASEHGLINLKDTERALKDLNRKLAIAEGKQALNTSGSDGTSSRIAKLAKSAVPAMVEGTKKGFAELANQFSGVGSGAMGLLANVLPIAGGLGLFGLMLWGVVEKDRLRAELGEVVNIAVAAGGDAHSHGMAWMAGFQERAQKFYGISRHEVQGIFKGFVDAGLSMDDMFKTIDKNLGEAGSNALALGLAADKHFEMSTGSTSKAATQAVVNYGMELGRATTLITDIEFQAHHAGMGVGNMVNWTISASANVRHLGVGIEEIASAAFAMKAKYASSGVNSEKWAKDSVTEMLGGISGMDTGREFWAAEQLGLGKGLEGRNALKSGITRQDPNVLKKLMRAWKKEADVAGGGDDLTSRLYLEKQGFGFEGAKSIMALGADSATKDSKVHEKKKEDKVALRNAFKEEGMKVSDLKKKTNEMLAGFAKMGQGMLQMLTGFMSLVIVSVKALPYYFLGTKDEAQKALDGMREQLKYISGGALTFIDGGKESLGAIWGIVGPLLEPLKQAWDFDPLIVHLSQDELAAFEEKDPGVRRDKIAALLGKYGALTPANLQALYQRQKSGDPEGLPLAMRPISASVVNAPKPSGKTPPISTPTPSAVTIEVNGKPMILGAAGGPRYQFKITWEGDPNAENLQADTTMIVGA